MTLALSEGGLVHTHAETERAFQRQPEGPTKFQTPRHQQSTSPRPSSADNTIRVHQEDPPPQRKQTLFPRRTKRQRDVATKRMEQFGRLALDIFEGPCLTSRAVEVIEQFVPFVADACGQSGFYWMMREIVARHAPLLEDTELNEIYKRTLPDAPSFKSAAIGKRWGVTPEQYERLALFHITPAGWGPRKLESYRGKRRNKRVKEKRHATDVSKTRRELSIAQLKPWKLPNAPCSSRAGFYRLPEDVRDALIARAREAAALRR